MDINNYQLTCCNLLKDIEVEKGLYDYYKRRINNNTILSKDDELLINYIIENLDKNSKIIEIAAGLGQVSHYLKYNGFKNITINECDSKRYNLAKILNDKLGNNCLLLKNFYQKIPLQNYDYIFTINGVSSNLGALEDLQLFEKLLNSGKKIILKEGYFGVKNDTMFTDKLKEKFNYEIIFETDSPVIIFLGMRVEYIDQKINNIGGKINKLSVIRLNELGERKSGLYDFYKRYYVGERPYWFHEYEKEIIKYIVQNHNNNTKILECCAGAAHILIALSGQFDFSNLNGNDLGTDRFSYAKYLINELCPDDKKINIMKKNFLNENQTNFNDYDIILITNIAIESIGNSIEEYNKFKKFLCDSSKELILLARCYGRSGFVVKKLFNDNDLIVNYIYKDPKDIFDSNFNSNNTMSVTSIKLKSTTIPKII